MSACLSGVLTNVIQILTDKIKEGSEILDLQLLDHIIIGGHGYCSFVDHGLLK